MTQILGQHCEFQVQEGATPAPKNAPGATQINALIAPEYGEHVFQEMMGCDAMAKYADLLLPPPVRLWFC